ncbi:hypothetical protein GWK47_022836 [Chionoecetes opilio]|uniref:Uncharacterized protein n=1 Tax=Chionoecetes opilio TaxID=41210 RepID=A0A8J4XMG6_CHIOP|nr:hypothetical protein GWK47_022836 [Chionoecetes opilio]
MASGGDCGVSVVEEGVVEVWSGRRSGGDDEVKEAEAKASVVEGGRSDGGECSEVCAVALKSVLEAIDDLKRYFVSDVNDLKSVVRMQEIEIRSLKCGGGVSGGAHARDVLGGVPGGDVPRATTKGVVSSKSPRNGEPLRRFKEAHPRRGRQRHLGKASVVKRTSGISVAAELHGTSMYEAEAGTADLALEKSGRHWHLA